METRTLPGNRQQGIQERKPDAQAREGCGKKASAVTVAASLGDAGPRLAGASGFLPTLGSRLGLPAPCQLVGFSAKCRNERPSSPQFPSGVGLPDLSAADFESGQPASAIAVGVDANQEAQVEDLSRPLRRVPDHGLLARAVDHGNVIAAWLPGSDPGSASLIYSPEGNKPHRRPWQCRATKNPSC